VWRTRLLPPPATATAAAPARGCASKFLSFVKSGLDTLLTANSHCHRHFMNYACTLGYKQLSIHHFLARVHLYTEILTHTHTHIHVRTNMVTHTHARTHTDAYTLTHILTHTLMDTLSHTHWQAKRNEPSNEWVRQLEKNFGNLSSGSGGGGG